MKIDQVQIGYRYRKDLGDLRSLVNSIAEVGLLFQDAERAKAHILAVPVVFQPDPKATGMGNN